MFRTALTVFVALGALAPITAAQHSTFETSSEGWGVVGLDPTQHAGAATAPPDAPFDPSDGRPPGSIRIGDAAAWTFVSAPAPFLGDHSGAYGSSVGFDMKVRFADASSLYPVLAIAGARITLYYSIEVSEIVLDQWTAWDIPLAPGPWVVDHYAIGAAATEADIREALADIRGFYIDTEYRTGPDDTSLDNIRLGLADSCYADCDGTGTLDFFDFLCFQNAFGAGCP
ncbi:MAG: laminin B domain-containing protein [Phycisphaerales bacterium JB039]